VWRRARAGRLLLAVVGALLFLGVGPAAADPDLRLSPSAGPPGSTLLVTGTGFAPSVVVIRWGDEAGDELGRAVGPDFALEVRVPDGAPPNVQPVVAVVDDGGSTSALSTSFEVTGAEAAEPPAPTSRTVEEPTLDTTPAGSPSPPPPSAARGDLSRTDSVGGGVDGGMADTTGGGEAGADVTGALGSGATGSTAGGAAGSTGDTTATTAPGAPPSPPADVAAAPPGAGAGPGGGQDGTAAAREGAGDASGAALAPRPTSQSAGSVRNPLLLFVGLGMVFVAGVILAVRNRQRTPGPPPQAG
jgi:hypothetical protein